MKKIALAFLSLLGSLQVVRADPSFTFTTIDSPGATYAYAWGINNIDQIVGLAQTVGKSDQGFLYSNGVFGAIGVPDVIRTAAWGINDSSQIVGEYTDTAHSEHGFLHSKGVYTSLDVPRAINTWAHGINDSGQIVGTYVDNGGQHGFLYDNGVFTRIDIPGAAATSPYGINSAGHVIGQYLHGNSDYGFVDTNGVFTGVRPPIEARWINWEPDYEEAFYRELAARARAVYLFRNEYLFVFDQTVVSEIPQAGHASYMFRPNTSLNAFLRSYAKTTRHAIRTEPQNARTTLGYAGRIPHLKDLSVWIEKIARTVASPVTQRAIA